MTLRILELPFELLLPKRSNRKVRRRTHSKSAYCSITYQASSTIGRYQIVVDIPDVDCEKCVLQLITPSTDKLSATMDSCVYDPLLTNDAADAGNNPRCYSTYHSCADISIKSSGNGGTLTPEKCTEPSDWPFRHGRQILGGNVRTARTSSPRRYYKKRDRGVGTSQWLDFAPPRRCA